MIPLTSAAIVTGIAAEARLARRLTDRVACSGGDPDRAAEQAAALVAQGAELLVSFGIAGGLAPELVPGTLVLATEIRTATGCYQADPELTKELGARLTPIRSLPVGSSFPRKRESMVQQSDGGKMDSRLRGNDDRENRAQHWGPVAFGPIYGGTKIASETGCKAALAARYRALAVDLESGPTAKVAAAAGIPFVAIRAIADPAWRGLPEAALLPLDGEGRPRLSAVFASIAKRPGQIPGLIATAFDTRAALRSLLRACRVLV